MPYKLYLLRHAKSDWSMTGQKDMDRELNSRGNSDAPRMGRKIYEAGFIPELIVCSPAKRTRMTAELVAEQMKVDVNTIQFNEEIYEASLRSLLKVINEQDDACKSMLMIGHNPGFTYLTEYLSKKDIGNFPTCGFAELVFEVDSWKEISSGLGTLKTFWYPKMEL